MQGIFLVITLTVLAANFLMDLVYGFIDPRARHNVLSRPRTAAMTAGPRRGARRPHAADVFVAPGAIVSTVPTTGRIEAAAARRGHQHRSSRGCRSSSVSVS